MSNLIDPDLRRLAEAATPGPWVVRKTDQQDIVRQLHWVACAEPDHNNCAIAQTVHNVALVRLGHSDDDAYANAAFIAAASPDVILALLARAEEAEAENARLEAQLKELTPPINQGLALVQLARQLDAATAEVERLRAFWEVVDSYLARGGDAADYLPLDVLAAWQRVAAKEDRRE